MQQKFQRRHDTQADDIGGGQGHSGRPFPQNNRDPQLGRLEHQPIVSAVAQRNGLGTPETVHIVPLGDILVARRQNGQF
jgi:hypothetical protein